MARGKGEHGVYQRANGRWVASVEAGYTVTGRKRRTVTAATKPEILRKLRALEEEIEAGMVGDDPTLETWLEHWLTEICPRRVKPTTIRGYQSYVDRWIVPTLGRKRVKALTPADVRRLHKTMRTAGRAEASVRQAHAILQRALKVAEREGHALRNVAALVDPPGTDVTPHETLTPAQARRVLRAARSPRELARLTCALVLGIRQGEALGLQWEAVAIDKDGGVIEIGHSLQRVKGESILDTPKSRASRRQIPVPATVARALLPYLEAPDDETWVFPGARGGKETNPRRDWQAWTDALDRAGVPHVPLHGARGSAASLLIELGVSDRLVADILGHRDVKVTHQHYITTREEQRRKAIGKAAKALKLAPLPAEPSPS